MRTDTAGHRIEDLAYRSGTTVRTIRAYQDRGLLPPPGRRGRANVYDASHLARLRQIAGLLQRGFTLASIKELLEAWDTGRGLGAVLGLDDAAGRPWSGVGAGEYLLPGPGALAVTAGLHGAGVPLPSGPPPDGSAGPRESGAPGRAGAGTETIAVALPAATVARVREVAGADGVAAFVAAAAEREAAARTMDALAARARTGGSAAGQPA
jgi:DNA-binding transcriptional MerR regulator